MPYILFSIAQLTKFVKIFLGILNELKIISMTRACHSVIDFPLCKNGFNKSIGTGKIVVELFSVAISLNV